VITIISFIFVLGVLIFVHELGHFVMARRIGVRVLTFSLGFGPKLLSFRRGDTEYCISAIPLGGYVKMAGETAEDARTGAPDEFLSKSKWQRFQVLVMGPVMNLALAVIVLAVVFLYEGAEVPLFQNAPVVVGTMTAQSVARTAGLQPGDRIISVGGVQTPDWEQFSSAIAGTADKQVEIVYERNGRTERRQMVPTRAGETGIGTLGVLPAIRPQILSVSAGLPAAAAGLQPHDVVLAANGEKPIAYERLLEVIRTNADRPVQLEIERGGQRQEIAVTPRTNGDVGRIGADISAFEVRVVRPGPVAALTLSVKRNWEGSKLILRTLSGLVTGGTSVRQLMGPVGIASHTGQAAMQGFAALLGLMAMISLNLGLLNLMPIPVLDGGHIAILALEGISRRDFSIQVKEKMLLAGFALLVLLMVTVIYNDLTRIAWIERAMPWR
jgi:regulator of sigma E protease